MADSTFMTDGQERKDGGWRMEEGDMNALDG